MTDTHLNRSQTTNSPVANPHDPDIGYIWNFILFWVYIATYHYKTVFCQTETLGQNFLQVFLVPAHKMVPKNLEK